MSTWKYMQNGQQCGPVDTAALLALLKNGTLTPETTVCKEGMGNWVPIRTVPELSGSASGGVPPQSVPPLSGGATPLADGETPDPADVDKNKIFAVLAYLGILFLVPLLAAKESRFARYHTNQGVVLFLAAIVCWIGAFVLTFILALIPIIKFIGCLIWPVVWLGILALVVIGIINAAKGECKPLPLIGQYKLIK
jgi:uncharacterized membrane protein